MTQERWTAVDRYFTDLLVPDDPTLQAVLAANAAAGLPAYDVSPLQGQLLLLLARLQGASRILELGTLGAYSTIWLARGLAAGGRLVTLELDPTYAEVARANLARAGLAGSVDVRVGRALDTLPQLVTEVAGPFDLTFIDADKPNNPHYLPWVLRLSRPGSLIVVDNVVRDGAVADAGTDDRHVQGVHAMMEMIAVEPRLHATAIQTVGAKGWDGMLLARVTDG